MGNRLVTALFTCVMTMSAADAQSYSEGQVWSYKARRGEEGSTLLINKIEHHAQLGAIYHISVAGVSVRNRHAPAGIVRDLPHVPVGKQTLDASCVELVAHSKPNPAYLEGYAEWKRAFDQRKAGVFTAPVAEIAEIIESAIK
jgi:hypothetical protein